VNATSRAFLQTVLTTDSSLAEVERATLVRIIEGKVEEEVASTSEPTEQLALTQKAAARALDVSRVTIWRMTRDCLLHPVEILPGVWRYPFEELARLIRPTSAKNRESRKTVSA
jgi:hypothetical protein